RTDFDVEVARRRRLLKDREIHPTDRMRAHVLLFDVGNDADDGDRGVATNDRSSERIAAREIVARHRLVEDRRARCRLVVPPVEVATAQQPRADSMDVVRTDRIVGYVSVRIRTHGESGNLNG